MPSWWLWAVLYSSLAQAWLPPPKPLLLQPRMLSSRQRRQSSLPQRHVLELNGWVAELTENTAFRVPHQDECQFYTGHVLGEPESYVALTECAGQHYGLIHVGDKEYTLQPTDNSDKHHILRRREAISDDVSPKVASYNLTGDTINDLELDFNDYEDDMEIPVHRPMKADNNEKEYFRDVNIISRPLKGVNGLWLEMAVVADYTVVQFHGKARVRHYILALMNIVSAIFNDPSLNANMTLVINKLFLQEDSDTVIRPGNAKKSLEAVNKWNYRHLMKLPPESSGWDAAVWVTRADLGGPSGFAPVGGICARTRSAALDRDEGLTSAFVIAHELAHLLGLTHDGDGDCDADARRGSVMASTVLATLHKYAWSTCSKKHFHQKSKSWYCMHRRSKDTGISLGGATELKNYVFTMDEQCRTEFGEGFSVCDSVRVSSPCSRLWCAHRALPQVCRTKRAPPLDGTPCALDHWCVSGFCEPISRQLSSGVAEAPRAGGWGVWHEWSDCGATCGYGLRARTRACDNPPPAGDGAHCAGAASEAQVCWAGRACVAATGRDIRADLCHRRSPAFIPYPHRNDSEWCSTWCVDGAGGEPINLGSLPDGTPCDYLHAHNLCYQGSCVPGRCNESDSTCSWCLDGFCNNNTLVYSRTLRRGWTRLAIIPHEARQLEVRMATPIALRFALKERGKPALELSKHQTKLGATDLRTDADVPMNLQVVQALPDEMNTPQEEYQGRIVSAGALLTWAQSDFEVLMRSDGALQADLMILAAREQRVAVEDGHQVQVFVNYSTPARRPQPYRWETERSACSVSCGGGVRWTRARCHPAHRCPPAARAPPVRYEPCNMHRCEWRWSAGEWEPCSASCGDQGLQERMVYCVPSSARITNAAELVNALVSPVVCTEPPLPRQQPCNRIPCPVYWRELSWTPCSTSCGRGFSYRPLECPSPEAAACGPRPPERRRRCRVRRCPPASDCRAPDASNYCVLQQLSRACLLPPFRKICCNACREHEVANPRS